MADGKDTRSFFRKVVNFVVNPATEWGESGKPDEAVRDSEFAKTELKAMIERKRRNDFVRKRELDMLRRLRRQCLTPEQLAALGSSSGMADTEGRADTEAPAGSGMKAKIDEIEQQMAGHAIPAASRRSAAPAPAGPGPGRDSATARTVPAALMDAAARARSVADTVSQEAPEPGLPAAPAARGGGAVVMPPVSPGPVAVPMDSRSPQAMEVTEAAHDPDLDEIAISYANGDNDTAERLLLALVRHGGARGQHAETWMVLFDLYRATGQQEKFETMAVEFADRFGRSAPQWFSVPKLIAEAAAATAAPRPRAARIDGRVGWVCPEQFGADAVAQLRSKTLTMPLPWVFDWSALKGVDAVAAEALLALWRHWGPQTIDMRWIGGERLAEVLTEAAPIGVPDADPVYWQLRLQMLCMCNRPDRFDEVAIDYCVTYEMSPPSWDPTVCRVRISGQSGGDLSAIAPTTMVGEASTSFVESQLTDEPGLVQMVRLELSGPLVGDISEVLGKLDQQLGTARLVEIACTRLLRVDFMASGDLLNWVLTRRREDRAIAFIETNRLVALFFRAIGIDEQATVKVRAV